jgi:hypothetical protein
MRPSAKTNSSTKLSTISAALLFQGAEVARWSTEDVGSKRTLHPALKAWVLAQRPAQERRMEPRYSGRLALAPRRPAKYRCKSASQYKLKLPRLLLLTAKGTLQLQAKRRFP